MGAVPHQVFPVHDPLTVLNQPAVSLLRDLKLMHISMSSTLESVSDILAMVAAFECYVAEVLSDKSLMDNLVPGEPQAAIIALRLKVISFLFDAILNETTCNFC